VQAVCAVCGVGLRVSEEAFRRIREAEEASMRVAITCNRCGLDCEKLAREKGTPIAWAFSQQAFEEILRRRAKGEPS
jgi:hypothetical protein